VLRPELHAERGFEWVEVGERSGMAEIAGVTTKCVKAWSRRSTRLREWARNNLVVVDGEPTAQQLAAAQKATRPAKPESKSWAELKQEWRADARGLELDRAAHIEARRVRRAAPRLLPDRARLARMVTHIDKSAFTRADLVELVGGLLPADAPEHPRHLIEKIVDAVSLRVTATRQAHHREGHELFTVDAVIAEEERIYDAPPAHGSTCAPPISLTCPLAKRAPGRISVSEKASSIHSGFGQLANALGKHRCIPLPPWFHIHEKSSRSSPANHQCSLPSSRRMSRGARFLYFAGMWLTAPTLAAVTHSSSHGANEGYPRGTRKCASRAAMMDAMKGSTSVGASIKDWTSQISIVTPASR
jgi:hypothetical protein